MANRKISDLPSVMIPDEDLALSTLDVRPSRITFKTYKTLSDADKLKLLEYMVFGRSVHEIRK